MEKKSKSRDDFDLDWTMPNVELVRAIFTYYHAIYYRALTNTHRHTQTTYMGEYSIVEVKTITRERFLRKNIVTVSFFQYFALHPYF